MKKNNTKVELKKYLSQKEKIKNTFIYSCIILIILTFVIFITYSYFIEDSGNIEMGNLHAAVPELEIKDKQIVENTNNQQAIYIIKNNSNINTYSYNLYYSDLTSGNYGTIYYKIPSKGYSHAKGIIKPKEEKKIYLVTDSTEHGEYLLGGNSPWNVQLLSGYEYTIPRVDDGDYEIKYSPLSEDEDGSSLNKLKEKLKEKYGIEIDEIQTSTPDFTKGYPNVTDNDSSKSGLYQAEDDDGVSYYFRGKVENNYVKFAGKLWRILRINGDETIRLILNENTGEQIRYASSEYPTKFGGYSYDNSHPCDHSVTCQSECYNGGTFTKNLGMGTRSEIATYLEDWYMKNLRSYDSYIANAKYCNDTSVYTELDNGIYFNPNERLISGKPSLKCPDPLDTSGELQTYGGVYELDIGLINIDELIMAGYPNMPSYGDAFGLTEENFLYRNYDWWTMTMDSSTQLFQTRNDLFPRINVANKVRIFSNVLTSDKYYVVPVINLKSDTKFTSGNGTVNSPYEISYN